MELTEERLAEIEARAAAATPGPWEPTDDGSYFVRTARDAPAVAQLVSWVNPAGRDAEEVRANWRFVAAARSDVPALVAEVRRLRAKVAEMEGDLQGEIKVGEKFVWEPNLPSARQQIVVTQVNVNSDGETWIESVDERGERHWNDEARFREACIRLR